jgi:hypothetical protein
MKKQLIKLGPADCGDDALRIMMPHCPPEIKPLVLWRNDIRRKMFRPRSIMPYKKKYGHTRRCLLISRVSTNSALQDSCSPFVQINEILRCHRGNPDFQPIGVILDFFVDGRKTVGRQLWDELVNCLSTMEDDKVEPVFDAIVFTEVSRLFRRLSKIFELREICSYYGIEMHEKWVKCDLAHPTNVEALTGKAVKAETETYTMGDRISQKLRDKLERFKTIAGRRHFGFRVVNEFDDPTSQHKRVIDSHWEKIEIEYNAFQYMFHQYLSTPSVALVSRKIKEKFGIKVKPATVYNLLRNTHAVGVHFVENRNPIFNYLIEKMENRGNQIPENALNDLSPQDTLPYKFYIPEIVVIDLETFLRVQEVLSRKKSHIEPIPGNPNRCHAPSRENGKSIISGILVCGKCNQPYVLYGPSGTRLLACQGKRKHKCNQRNSIREEVILDLVLQGVRETILTNFPEFLRIYKQEREKTFKTIENDIRLFSLEIAKTKNHQMKLLERMDGLLPITRLSFEEAIQEDKYKIDNLLQLIGNRQQQIDFLKATLSYDDNSVRQKIDSLDAMLLNDPTAANEALKGILSDVIIHDVTRVDTKRVKIKATFNFKMSYFLQFFNKGLPKKNFLYCPSTEQTKTIVPLCSVEAQICSDFTVYAPKATGTIKQGCKPGLEPEWKFARKGNGTPIYLKMPGGIEWKSHILSQDDLEATETHESSEFIQLDTGLGTSAEKASNVSLEEVFKPVETNRTPVYILENPIFLEPELSTGKIYSNIPCCEMA